MRVRVDRRVGLLLAGVVLLTFVGLAASVALPAADPGGATSLLVVENPEDRVAEVRITLLTERGRAQAPSIARLTPDNFASRSSEWPWRVRRRRRLRPTMTGSSVEASSAWSGRPCFLGSSVVKLIR